MLVTFFARAKNVHYCQVVQNLTVVLWILGIGWLVESKFILRFENLVKKSHCALQCTVPPGYISCAKTLYIFYHIIFLSYLDKQFEKRQKLSKSQRHMTKTSSTCTLMFSLTPRKWQSRKWLTCICLEVAVWDARYFNPGLFNLKLRPQNFQRGIFQPLTI